MSGRHPSVFLALILVQSLFADCLASSSGTQQELDLQHVFKHLVVDQSYPRCSSLNWAFDRLVCEVWDQEDEGALLHLGQYVGNGSNLGHPSPCPDSSVNKSCVPRLTDHNAFLCGCNSLREEPILTSYAWDAEWRDMNGPRPGLYRKLCDQTVPSCVAAEYKLGLAHLVKYTRLPDDRITASSEYNSNHLARQVRIDNYFNPPCSWHPLVSDPNKWVQFDLIQPYVGFGILVRRRCDHGDHVTNKIRVAISMDTLSWQDSEDIELDYGTTESSAYESCTHWFQQPFSGRFWRIYPLQFYKAPAMKADIIGKV